MEYLAPLMRYATLLAVAVAFVFGVAAVLHNKRYRYLTAAAGMVQTVQTETFTLSMQRILDLPEAAEPDLVLSDPEAVNAAYVVGHVFEGLGVMVFHRLLPLDVVDELIGGYLRASWLRLEPYIARRRVALGPSFAEWFQWLVERAVELSPADARGAAEAHRNWRPRLLASRR
jgi:hypothetical protein